jgi:hypothetical protein
MRDHICEAAKVASRAAGIKRALGIFASLEWAFGTERAELDFDDLRGDGARPGVSGIYVLMQRGALGCQIDGGGKSRPAHDAEVIANAVAALPVQFGGRGMAVQIATLARAGARPDYAPNPRPRCAPRDVRGTKHGVFAVTEKIGTVETLHRGRKVVHDLLICPVTYCDTADEVAQVREGYTAWWLALDHLRAQLIAQGGFDKLVITDAMPPRRPWAVRPSLRQAMFAA